MKIPATIVAVLAVSAVPGCKKKSADTGSTGSGSATTTPTGSGSGSGSAAVTPPPAAAGALEGTFDGKPYKFTSATIESVNGHDTLKLSTGALKCGDEAADGDTTLSIDVQKGPGGKHYAPGPMATPVELYNSKQEFAIGNTLHGVLTTEPAEWKEGNKVKGTLRIADAAEDQKGTYTASGSFEATVCEMSEDPEGFQALPEEADKGPVSGTVGGKPFTFKSGIAELRHDKARDVDEILTIDLFDTAVDCTNYRNDKGMKLGIGGAAGASGKDVIVGSPQPWSMGWMVNGTNYFFQGPLWVKFDAIELKEGSVIKGSLHGEANPALAKEHPDGAGKLSGTFTATVCKL
jgi:hypothetical protein